MKHLAKYLHDVTLSITEVWCETGFRQSDATDHIEEATCLRCLEAAVLYGNTAVRRYIKLQGFGPTT